LLAPLNSNPDQWNKISYVDAHTGKVYGVHDRHKERRVNGTVQDDSEIPMPQLYGNVLYALQNHREAKSAGGDGIGLLGRWQVHAKKLQVMGKEIDRQMVSGESFAEITPEPQLIYEIKQQNSVVNKRTLDPMVIERLRSKYRSMRSLAKKTKLNFRTVRRALNRKPIQLKNWQSLMRVSDH